MTSILFCKVGGLGDSLSALPALAALCACLPDAAVTVLCSAIGAEVFAAVPGPRLVTADRAALVGAAGLGRVPALARRLGRHDVALLSHDECSAVHLVARLTARRRIGFAASIARGEALLRERLPFDADAGPYVLAQRLVRSLCPQAGPPRRVRPMTEAPVPWLARRGVSGPYGIVHSGAAGALQRWGVDRFTAAARMLSEATGLPWLLIDGPSGLTLAGLAGVMAGARGVVGNHSGPLHLAAALGVPWVAVAGPSARAWDPPWRDVPGRVLRGDLDCVSCGRVGAPAVVCPRGTPGACLDALTPREVTGAMLEILESPSACSPRRLVPSAS